MKISKSLLSVAAIGALFAGCQDEDFGFATKDVKSSKYADEFVKAFGEVDPNQDWSMAAETRALVNLPSIKGTAKMNIMTGNPSSASARLLGQTMIQNGQAEFNFDALKGVSSVFVTIEQDGKYLLFGNYAINNGQLNIGQVDGMLTRAGEGDPTTPSFSATCPTTQSTTGNYLVEADYAAYPVFDRKEYKYNNEQHTWEEWEAIVPTKVNANNSTQYLPYTDESVRHFVQGVEIDWENSNLVLKAGAVASTEDIIYDDNFNNKYTIAAAKAKAEEEINSIVNGWYTHNPYETSSLKLKEEDGVIVIDWDNSTPVLKSGWTLYAAGDVITWNNRTTSKAIFMSEAENNMSAILGEQHNTGVTYTGPWEASSIKVNTVDVVAGVNGAVYVGLFDVELWVKKEDVEEVTVNKAAHPQLQYLTGVEKAPSQVFGTLTASSFFGPGSFFEEQKAYNSSTKLGVYYDETEMYKMEQGFAIKTTAATTTIDMPVIFGCTDYSNQFGYVYWKTGDELKPDFNPMTLKHFVLIEDARPQSNVYQGGVYGENAVTKNSMATGISNFVNASQYVGTPEGQAGYDALNVPYVGTTYRVMYFGDDYTNTTGSYDWDEGYTIMFFISTLTRNTDGDDLLFTDHKPHGVEKSFNYSLSKYNKLICDPVTLEPTHKYKFAATYPEKTDLGMVKCITYTRNGATYMGFGDNMGDEDLNDIVFLVNGTFDTEIPLKKFAPVRWHYNYDGNSTPTTQDLFDEYSLSLNMEYNEPKQKNSDDGVSDTDAIPASRSGYVFKGWSKTPDAEEGTFDVQEVITSETGDDWYAIWAIDIPVQPDPEWQSWIFACEDLGGSFDYDFNDLVFAVKKTAITGSDNVKLELIPLAAGGTLEAHIKYGDSDKGEIHKLLSGTDDFSVAILSGPGSAVTLAESVEAGITLSAITSNLQIVVTQSEDDTKNGTYTLSHKDHDKEYKTPEIIILPEGWDWPNEGVIITKVYPGFASWTANVSETAWIANKSSEAQEGVDYIVNPLKPAAPAATTVTITLGDPVKIGNFNNGQWDISDAYACPLTVPTGTTLAEGRYSVSINGGFQNGGVVNNSTHTCLSDFWSGTTVEYSVIQQLLAGNLYVTNIYGATEQNAKSYIGTTITFTKQ